MNKIKLLPLITAPTIAITLPVVSACSPGIEKIDWSDFNYDATEEPTYTSTKAINLKEGSSYIASFKIDAPSTDLEDQEAFRVIIKNDNEFYDFENSLTSQLKIGDKEQTLEYSKSESIPALLCDWDINNLNKTLWFKLTCTKNFDNATIFFTFYYD